MTEKTLKRLYSITCICLVFLVGFLAGAWALRAILNNKSEEKPLPEVSAPEISDGYNLYEDLYVFNELYNVINTRYMGEFDPDEAMEAALKQYVESLNDPFSVYMTNEQADGFIDGAFGEKVGIGVRIYRYTDPVGMYVYQVIGGSPAEEYGVLEGDIVIGVDGTEVTEENYNALVDSVSGEEGTTVTITVLREGNPVDIPVVRGNFVASSVEYKMLNSAENIGYIRILSLASDTASSFKNAVTMLQKMGAKKYIFDVRNNSGGYLSSIIEVLDMLLPEGPIVRYNDANGNETSDNSDASTIISAPMAVLMNGRTASAAELFSSALKDYELAVLVGETTFGKGVMQTLFTLPNGDTLKLTTSTYSPPFSENYNLVGVKPHIEVSLPEDKEYYMLSEKEDTQLQAAITALEGEEKQD